MSETTSSRSPAGAVLAAFVLGLLITGLCLTGSAAWMEQQALSRAAAWPLSTAAVCFGTLVGGGLSAFLQKSRGLVCGAVEGLLMAGLLLALLFGNDGVPEPAHELRCAMTLCAGCLGGYCGMLWSEKHRRRNF